MKKGYITIFIILAVIGLSILILSRSSPETPKEVVECIGKNSVLYVQLGCHACKIQEEMFGDYYRYLNTVDCWFERDKCSQIYSTPTWIINGKKYEDVKSIEELKELTGCE